MPNAFDFGFGGGRITTIAERRVKVDSRAVQLRVCLLAICLS